MPLFLQQDRRSARLRIRNRRNGRKRHEERERRYFVEGKSDNQRPPKEKYEREVGAYRIQDKGALASPEERRKKGYAWA